LVDIGILSHEKLERICLLLFSGMGSKSPLMTEDLTVSSDSFTLPTESLSSKLEQ
jgi:hypothetical protein